MLIAIELSSLRNDIKSRTGVCNYGGVVLHHSCQAVHKIIEIDPFRIGIFRKTDRPLVFPSEALHSPSSIIRQACFGGLLQETLGIGIDEIINTNGVFRMFNRVNVDDDNLGFACESLIFMAG